MRICSIYEIRTDRGNVKYSQKNLYQCHFVHHMNHAGLRGENPATNSLTYGTTHYRITNKQTNKQTNNSNNNNNNNMKYSRTPSGMRRHWVIGSRRFEAVLPSKRGDPLPSDTASYSRRTGSSTTLPCKSQDWHMKHWSQKTIITEALKTGKETT
jgi:hypothetical protein